MKKKLLFSVVISSILVISSSNVLKTIEAKEVNSNKDEISLDFGEDVKLIEIKNAQNIENNEDNTRLSEVVINKVLNDSTGSQSVIFSNSESMRYYRVWVKNNSNVRYVVSSEAGSSYVEPNSASLFYTPEPAKVKERIISVTSKDGSALNGHIAIRIGSDLDSVKK